MINLRKEVASMRYGLIGEKLGHSFSKTIHEQIADYTYDLIPLTNDEFHTFMRQRDFTAINVTIPYKKEVIPYLDEVDDHAAAIGAVNTIVNRDGKLYGYNTDFCGFLYMTQKHNVQMKDKKVLVLGNGGASSAIQAVVKHLQASEMIVVDIIVGNGAISYEECFQKHLDAEVIINTSPIGMYPKVDRTPIDIKMFPNCKTVMDVIYNPLTTRLCLNAAIQGIQQITGLEMLIAQAKYAVEHFLSIQVDNAVIDDIYHDLCDQHCNLVLIGMPSAGKTTIGSALADRLHKTYVDIDEIIVKTTNKTIPEIFEAENEEGFRQREHEAVCAAAKESNQIIATGGGVIKNEENIRALQQNGRIIFVNRDLEHLICNDANRPLSSDYDAVKALYKQRYPLYRTYSDVIVQNNNSIEQTIDVIEKDYKAYIQNK